MWPSSYTKCYVLLGFGSVWSSLAWFWLGYGNVQPDNQVICSVKQNTFEPCSDNRGSNNLKQDRSIAENLVR